MYLHFVWFISISLYDLETLHIYIVALSLIISLRSVFFERTLNFPLLLSIDQEIDPVCSASNKSAAGLYLLLWIVLIYLVVELLQTLILPSQHLLLSCGGCSHYEFGTKIIKF